MRRFVAIIALIALSLGLAAPAWADVVDVILYGTVVTNLEEDGSTTTALQLSDGTVLPKQSQHPANMAKLGEVLGKGRVWQWIDTPERAAVIRSEHATAYLGKSIDDLPAEAQEYVLEVEVDGARMKVAEARAKGVDVDALEKIKPHEWQK